MPLHERDSRWAAIVAHRRAGKTVACINDLVKGALTCRRDAPRFAYLAPYYAQAKDVAWSYLKRFTAPIPGVETHESELRVTLPNNGAMVRLYGADNYDRLRGGYFDGIVLDEYGDMDPRAWSEVIRPALSDRRGWAVFIGTPKGRNHFCDLIESAKGDPAWLVMILRASETGLLAPDELADARKTMTEEEFAQEYECSFDAAVKGSYYGTLIEAAEREKRIGAVPPDTLLPVHTAWDLGIGDSTAIWFCQRVGREWRLIDYVENAGVGLDWYVNQLRSRPYTYGEHLLPHDVQVKELGTGRSRLEVLNTLGVQARVIPAQSVEDGINAGRLILPTCWFDAEKCKRGIEALRMYRRKWDEKLKAFNDSPLHDWSSHAADAFRYLALGNPQSNETWGKALPYPKRKVV